jgi:hypothetical protein
MRVHITCVNRQDCRCGHVSKVRLKAENESSIFFIRMSKKIKFLKK